MTSPPVRPGANTQCPRCQRWSVTPPVCAWCGYNMAQPWRPPSRGPSVDRLITGHWSSLLGGALGALAAITLWRTLVGLSEGRLAAAALGFLLGALFARAFTRRRVARQLASDARRYVQNTAVRRIHDADEGLVRVVGVVHAVTTSPGPDGQPCVALERRTMLPDGAVRVHAEGGAFELDDGSGVRALVRAEHVSVPEGRAVGDTLVIPPGARVEIVGVGRWVMARADGPGHGSLRTAARTLEIVGTPEVPVVVRMVQDVTDAPDDARVAAAVAPARRGVRVAPEAEPVDPLLAEAERELDEFLSPHPPDERRGTR